MQISLSRHPQNRQPANRGAIALFLALLSLDARAEVLVVTDHQHPVQSVPNARLIELDVPGRIETDLAANLPTVPDQAAATVQQRLQQGGDPLQRRLGIAWQGVAEAWGLGIAKIPAVVVDRRYVVYGEPDVAGAVARIDAFRRTQP